MEVVQLELCDMLESSRCYIANDLKNLAVNFLKLGYHLYEVQRCEYYKAGGYSDVAEFAEVEFGIKKSSCYNYIKLVQKYSVDGHSMFLQEKFKDYNMSQLTEMLSMDDLTKSKVNKDMSVKEIREIKKYGAVLDEDKQRADIEKFCYFKKITSNLSVTEVKEKLEKSFKSKEGMGRDDFDCCFQENMVLINDYKYTASSLLAAIKKYVGLRESSFQTSGIIDVGVSEESGQKSYEERYNESHDKTLNDDLMDILKNNIKNVDKVAALIQFISNLI